MDSNALGVFLCLKHEIPVVLEAHSGAIVNNPSVSGVVGFPGSAIYVASKHAVWPRQTATGGRRSRL
jgi:NADP-dependent 3-hydroxy acid dehydrogenase YdfG